MMVIGITGTLGAGKGTVVDYLVRVKGFSHYSVRSFLQREMANRGMPNNRDSMTTLANELRAKNSPSYVTDQLFEEAQRSGQNCIIESIRTPGEIISLRQKGTFYLFAVDADPTIRYERIVQRASETDHISYQTFVDNEAREMNNTDPNKQNLAQCIQLADFFILNNSDLNHLEHQVEQIINKLQAHV